MTTIQLISDAHLEFGPLELSGGDVLLLAGDITVANYLRSERTDADARDLKKVCKKFFFEECGKYKKVFYIAGNHEHYSGVYEDTHDILREYLVGSNVTYLQNEVANIDDKTVVFGATLWTDFSNGNPLFMNAANHGMNDFHIIQKKYNTLHGVYQNYTSHDRLRCDDVIEEHKNTLKVLREQLIQHDKNFIVMTHHCPSFKSSHPKHGINNPLNYAYCSELSGLFYEYARIKYWVHGHTHDSHDYPIDNARVLCNPRGYAPHDLNPNFNPTLTFEV